MAMDLTMLETTEPVALEPTPEVEAPVVEPTPIRPAAPAPVEIPAGAPHFKRSTRWVELPPDIAEGCKFLMVTSYPASLREDLTSGDAERATPALLSICMEHNGWLGEDGQPLPPMNTMEFWGAPNLTDEVGATVVSLVLTEPREHPFLARQKRGR